MCILLKLPILSKLYVLIAMWSMKCSLNSAQFCLKIRLKKKEAAFWYMGAPQNQKV